MKNKIKEVLFTDRGGMNTKKILSMVKDEYVEKTGFVLLIIMMLR